MMIGGEFFFSVVLFVSVGDTPHWLTWGNLFTNVRTGETDDYVFFFLPMYV